MTRHIAVVLIACCLASTNAWAQTDLVTTPPQNLVIPNYNSTSIGPYGGLEGTAFVARVSDPSAAWFNPAGLSRQDSAQISGSAGVYQWTGVAPRALPNRGGSLQQLPNFVGFTFVPRDRVTVGAALLSTNAWEQETDAELFSPTPGGQQRFAYSADSQFEQRVLAVSVGYEQSDAWRIGGGFALSLMNLRLVQSASDRIADPAGLRSLLVSARASGSALQLRAQGGVQYDAGQMRLGGAVRTPGLTIHKSGTVVLDGVIAGLPGSAGASLFDPGAALEYRLPWEFQTGVAFVGPRLEVEFDVQAFTSIEAYPLLSSGQPVLRYADAGANALPIVTSSPYPGLTSASDGVVNVGAGVHYRLFKDRNLLVHAGVGSNRSQVAPADDVFNKVDLGTWSLGASGVLGKFQFAIGISRQQGTADDVSLRNLLNGGSVNSPVEIRLTGLIYSLAYQF